MVAKSHNIMYTRVKEKRGVLWVCLCWKSAVLTVPLPSAPKWTVSDIVVSSKIDSGSRNLGLLTRLVVAATTVHPFFCKDLFYKNVEAEINQNFKNVLIKNIPQAESQLRTFLFC